MRLTRKGSQLCSPPFGPGFRPVRARSSAGEHSLHTGGVTGSIPVAPTICSSCQTSFPPAARGRRSIRQPRRPSPDAHGGRRERIRTGFARRRFPPEQARMPAWPVAIGRSGVDKIAAGATRRGWCGLRRRVDRRFAARRHRRRCCVRRTSSAHAMQRQDSIAPALSQEFVASPRFISRMCLARWRQGVDIDKKPGK